MKTENEDTSLPVSIVTGGGRGIGRAIALRLSRSSHVAITGRTAHNLKHTAATIRALGGSASSHVHDVQDRDAVFGLIDTFRPGSDLGPITSLVCNAAYAKSGPTDIYRIEDWANTIDTNLTGAFNYVQACLPGMLRRKSGVICLMSSTAGLKGYSHNAAYVASKHALIGLARALAAEYGKHGIIAVPICPGFVESEMTDRTIAGVMQHRGVSKDAAEAIVAVKSPQDRILSGLEVAEAVAMVCERKMDATSGSPLILSGGEV